MEVGKKKSLRWPKTVILLMALIALIFIAQGLFLTGGVPSVDVSMETPAIGRRTPFQVNVSEPKRGLSFVKTELVQGDKTAVLIEKTYPLSSQFLPWGSQKKSDILSGTAGLENMAGLKEGSAIIRVTTGRAPTWLRHPDPYVHEISLQVRLTPPSLEVTSIHMYVTQGGCELVTYRIDETAVRDGVQSGPWWFPGYPLPGGGERERFALFAAPYDMEEPDIRLIAVDDAGNEAQRDFIDRFHAKRFKTDTINIDDAFIDKVVPDILAQSPEIEDRGDPLENYVAVNRELRLKNAETIKDLAHKSKPEFLWAKSFQMLPNSKVTATFGDKRTYRYKDATIDSQTHLGYDLASIRMAAIPSPNTGTVLHAGFLGIYGNTVIIDHGYGLLSICGHLSSIAVAEGQEVSRGEVIGRTGDTGLAGGDHLHYGILLQGLPVNPLEWSDSHWIHDRIAEKLGANSPFTE